MTENNILNRRYAPYQKAMQNIISIAQRCSGKAGKYHEKLVLLKSRHRTTNSECYTLTSYQAVLVVLLFNRCSAVNCLRINCPNESTGGPHCGVRCVWKCAWRTEPSSHRRFVLWYSLVRLHMMAHNSYAWKPKVREQTWRKREGERSPKRNNKSFLRKRLQSTALLFLHRRWSVLPAQVSFLTQSRWVLVGMYGKMCLHEGWVR